MVKIALEKKDQRAIISNVVFKECQYGTASSLQPEKLMLFTGRLTIVLNAA